MIDSRRPELQRRARATKRFPGGGAARVGLAASVACVVWSAEGQPYRSDIDRWLAQDQLDPIEPGGVLFVGSSSIRRWEQLASDFTDYRVIQRGFGGSQLEDLVFYTPELVVPYAPSAIVVWSGTNDLSTGEPAAEVFADFQSFVTLVQAALPTTRIVYLGVTPTPANTGTTAARDEANALIQAAADADPLLWYIDLPSAFYALNPPNDPAFTSLYVDPVHLNRAGYELWTSIIRPELVGIVPPNRVFSANPLTPGPGARLLFDFGPSNPEDGAPTPSPDASGLHWNNWHPAEGGVAINAGEHLASLVTTSGQPTGVRLTITGGFGSNGLVNGGLTDPDQAALGSLGVASATQDYFFSGADDRVGGGDDDVPGSFRLEGLDPSSVYELRFFGSRSTGEEIRETEFLVTGATMSSTTLVTSGPGVGTGGRDGNDSIVATVGGIRPTAFGDVFVDLTVVRGRFAYLNAMELRVVPVSIRRGPTHALVDAGGTLTLNADVEGSSTEILLQWTRDGEPLEDDGRVSGATTDHLHIAGVGRFDAGEYRLVASAAGETVETAPAIVGVRSAGTGSADFNGDGLVNSSDLIDLLETQVP
ncbi:MAG: GDSL-type esterase/lipase family protein [Phycisphaerales bacterium]